MAELPLVIVNVMRGGPSTGLPTKSEQTDLLQALYGRNGESPIPVISARTSGDCFDAAYYAAKVAIEHMTPVILLTDAYVANGSVAWRIPEYENYPAIVPPYVSNYSGELKWTPFMRNEDNLVRYWAVPGTKGFQHRLGGLEKDNTTGVISTNPQNHQLMVNKRKRKVELVANSIPELEIEVCSDPEYLLVGWGGTYGHLHVAAEKLNQMGYKVGHVHFSWINPLPKNAIELLTKFSNKAVVAEQNTGQLAIYLRGNIPGFNCDQYNVVEGQPLQVGLLVETLAKVFDEKQSLGVK